MNLDNALIARLVLGQLPGLAGAMQPGATQAGAVQPGAAAPDILGELIRRQRSQSLTNAMLSAASALLSPSPNRYPLAPLQRLGLGLGAAMQEYKGGTRQGQLLDALRMGGGAAAPAVARTGLEAASAPGAAAPASVGDGREATAAAAADAGAGERVGKAGARLTAPGGKTRAAEVKFEDFSGKLTRLESPPTLPGGWKLYGYDKDSGKPVYVGPGQRLRVYG